MPELKASVHAFQQSRNFFTSDEAPTDEQLAVIMEEVGKNVRRESVEISRKLFERLEHGYHKAKEYDESR
jgi:UDP-N-acetylmuramyl tripeptide synthase